MCGNDVVSKTYEAPKELLYGRKAKQKPLNLTEEEKEARRCRLRANLSKKNS